MANIAQASNLRNLVIPLRKVHDWMLEHPTATDEEIDAELAKYLTAAASGEAVIQLQYYEASDSFVGTKFINSSDTEKYIDKCVQLSREQRKNNANDEDKKPRVAVITDDENSGRWTDKDVTVINSAKVQGGEFDYVIIDKVFDYKLGITKTFRDFYTLIGRARNGVVIVGNEEVRKKFSIQNSEVDASIKDAPISFVDDSQDLVEWKKGSVDFIQAAELPTSVKAAVTSAAPTNPVETPSPAADSGTPEMTAEEKEVVSALQGNSHIGDKKGITYDPEEAKKNKKAAIETTIPPKPDYKAKIEKDLKESQDAQTWETEVSKVKTVSTVSDYNSFLDYVTSDPAFINGESNLKITEGAERVSAIHLFDNTEAGKKLFIQFVKTFAPAVLDNMYLDTKAVERFIAYFPEQTDIIKALSEQWNLSRKDGKENFVIKRDTSTRTSTVYWQFAYKDKTYLIPITRLNGEDYEGQISVDGKKGLFNLKYTPTRIDAGGRAVPLSESIKHGRILTSVRIFGPRKEGGRIEVDNPSLQAQNDSFYDNVGKTFVVWTDNPLVSDEDLEEIFAYKIVNGQRAFYINAERLKDDLTGDASYRLKNGAIVKLLNVHRELNLGQAYDLVNILRFTIGACEYSDLSNVQKALLGNRNAISAGVEYLKGIFGDFNWPGGISVNTKEENEILKERIKALDNTYRILSSRGNQYWFGAVYAAMRSLPKEGPTANWAQDYEWNLVKILYREAYKPNKSDRTRQTGLALTFNTNSTTKKYFVKYRRNGKQGYFDVYQLTYNGIA